MYVSVYEENKTISYMYWTWGKVTGVINNQRIYEVMHISYVRLHL